MRRTAQSLLSHSVKERIEMHGLHIVQQLYACILWLIVLWSVDIYVKAINYVRCAYTLSAVAGTRKQVRVHAEITHGDF